MDKFTLYVSYFFFYSFIGWILECIWCSTSETRKAKKFKFVNRGFLMGPLCPIYGCSAVAMSFFLQPFSHNFLIVLFLGILVCDTIEYLTSYIMEKIFNARWWDYSQRFMNLHGRICLQHTCIWGLLSLAFIYIINPFSTNIILSLSGQHTKPLIYTLLVLFAVDFFIAVVVTMDIKMLRKKIRLVYYPSEADEKIEVVEIGSSGNNNVFYRLNDFKAKMESLSKIRRRMIRRVFRSVPRLKAQVKRQFEDMKSIPTDFKAEVKDEMKELQTDVKNLFGFDSND
ncbi:MAG: putative ABC transporter permease [Acutalibacteraceae bacterium]|nr:putative ABC transporter permease [Clostridiales bacterium]